MVHAVFNQVGVWRDGPTPGAPLWGSQWPTRDSAQSHHLNSNFLLLRRVDGSKQVSKLSPLLSCLFD